MAAKVGTGTTIVFGTSSVTAEYLSVTGSGNHGRTDIDISHLGSTGYRQYIPGTLLEGGEFTLNMHFDGTEAIPVTAGTETITIAPGGNTATGTTISFPGYVKSFSPTITLEEKMTADVTIKVAGTIS